jgi:EAL domain-containing protein (putative c-di-GMP-specific phosphodiesterase class I)
MMPNEQHLAEHSGIIGEIGRWVLERACADGHRWQNTGQRDNLTMSVNVGTDRRGRRHRDRRHPFR